MNAEKQIDEMACDMCTVKLNCNSPHKPIPTCQAYKHAVNAYDYGYCKQIEGEWINDNGKSLYKCSVCGHTCPYDAQGDDISYWTCKFCPNCGARMKGGAE